MQIQCTRSNCTAVVERDKWQIARARFTFCSPECRIAFYPEWKAEQALVRINRDGPVPESHPEYGRCWIWPGKPNPNGYCPATDRRGGISLAHRMALESKVGPLPGGFFALHTCDVRNCVRNDEEGVYVVRGIVRVRWGHLFVGTRADNMADMSDKGRKGNGWTPENRHKMATGSRHGRSKLTEDAVREIRRLYATGKFKQRDLGAMFGVHAGTIGGITTGKEWRHLP